MSESKHLCHEDDNVCVMDENDGFDCLWRAIPIFLLMMISIIDCDDDNDDFGQR